MLADWALFSSSTQISLGEVTFLLLSPCTTSIAATLATLLMNQLGNDRSSWGKWPTDVHRMGYPVFLKSYFLKSLFDEHSHGTHSSSHCREVYPFTSSLDLLVAVSDHLAKLFSTSLYLAKLLVTTHELMWIHISGHLSF